MSDLKENLPENGWLVMCPGLGIYLTTSSSSLESLANVLGSVVKKADEDSFKNNTNRLPIQVYELGRQMDVGLKYVVSRLDPVQR